jgi:hypothetical protein
MTPLILVGEDAAWSFSAVSDAPLVNVDAAF